MNKWLLCLMFLLVSIAASAQKDKDSLVNSLPVVNGKLTYSDSISVKGRNKATLDSTAKKWFAGYFKYHQVDTLSKDKDVSSSVLSQGVLEFRIATTSLALVKYDFYLIITLKINCNDGNYTYKIFDTYFMPKNQFFRRVIVYQNSPDYLIGLYKQKHMGFGPSINYGRKKVREYLKCTDDAIQACIASLNTAMTN
ncbi:DUF4468 domain-containing protein [Mucilaginibacter frigoritolerans]|nr:DUF4468 domain-containing protein [Mucilaginibacter frigoritolerans]